MITTQAISFTIRKIQISIEIINRDNNRDHITFVAVILTKGCSETPFSKKSYHIETS